MQYNQSTVVCGQMEQQARTDHLSVGSDCEGFSVKLLSECMEAGSSQRFINENVLMGLPPSGDRRPSHSFVQ